MYNIIHVQEESDDDSDGEDDSDSDSSEEESPAKPAPVLNGKAAKKVNCSLFWVYSKILSKGLI